MISTSVALMTTGAGIDLTLCIESVPSDMEEADMERTLTALASPNSASSIASSLGLSEEWSLRSRQLLIKGRRVRRQAAAIPVPTSATPSTATG